MIFEEYMLIKLVLNYSNFSSKFQFINIKKYILLLIYLARIVQTACPSSWKKSQVQANMGHLSLVAQTRYYTGLKSVEGADSNQSRKCDIARPYNCQ
jgi:hypothetical protein